MYLPDGINERTFILKRVLIAYFLPKLRLPTTYFPAKFLLKNDSRLKTFPMSEINFQIQYKD